MSILCDRTFFEWQSLRGLGQFLELDVFPIDFLFPHDTCLVVWDGLGKEEGRDSDGPARESMTMPLKCTSIWTTFQYLISTIAFARFLPCLPLSLACKRRMDSSQVNLKLGSAALVIPKARFWISRCSNSLALWNDFRGGGGPLEIWKPSKSPLCPAPSVCHQSRISGQESPTLQVSTSDRWSCHPNLWRGLPSALSTSSS